MIELNLLPDVKQELIKAQRVRNAVVSVSIMASIIAATAAGILAAYVYGAQPLIKQNNGAEITKQHAELMKIEDLKGAVTVQKQLQVLSDQHKSKNISSRMFDILSAINPQGTNLISYRSVELNTIEKKITIEAVATNGYSALEAFKKTILATKFEYKNGDDTEFTKVNLTEKVADGDRSLSEDESRLKVLRFTVSFVYDDALFARDSKEGKIITPTKTNVTDSATTIPKSMLDGGNQ